MPEFTRGHAVVVGVGRDLPATVKDGEGIAAILRDPERCAYPPEQVTELLGPNATKAAIIRALRNLASTATTRSTSVIYFSGHGIRTGETHYLLPHDYDPKDLTHVAISDAELTGALAGLVSAQITLILDCCHPTELPIEDLGAKTVPMPPEARRFLTSGTGRALLASSRSDERSYVAKPYSHFTAALIEGFSGVGNAGRDAFVRVTDLAMYASEIVPRRTRGRQHPTLDYSGHNFALAYFAAGGSVSKGAPFAFEGGAEEPALKDPVVALVVDDVKRCLDVLGVPQADVAATMEWLVGSLGDDVPDAVAPDGLWPRPVREAVAGFRHDLVLFARPERLLETAWYVSTSKLSRMFRAHQHELGREGEDAGRFLLLHRYLADRRRLAFEPALRLLGRPLPEGDDTWLFFHGEFRLTPDARDAPMVTFHGAVGAGEVRMSVSRKYLDIDSHSFLVFERALLGDPITLSGFGSLAANTLQPVVLRIET
ncbi:caspase family protein [Streptacidiphilus rugosus]|uniref:caspase family protein n=1 Tax=Streptacidiphilus rugosus TaxID=405783 RepID=UPI0006896A65|nr:caspase family protein [Streptacidiphilus rugosus]